MRTRILMAEEEQECSELFRQFLQRSGYEVTVVCNGSHCIEALNTGPAFDLLILSWELPHGEGEVVLDWLGQRGGSEIEVVVLTARMDANFQSHERLYPDVTWVQRPFRLPVLLDAVQATERVPHNSGRCLDQRPRKSSIPVLQVLSESRDY